MAALEPRPSPSGPQRIVGVDAFAERAFAGNPAAVCVLGQAGDEAWMRQVAREMNLSETAFLHPDNAGWALRWFTPTVEVDLCGHATLASAHVLWSEGHLPGDETAVFQTRSGELRAVQCGDAIEIDLPALPPEPCEPPAGLGAALGLEPVRVGRSRFDVIAELGSVAEVRALRPNLRALAQVAARGVIVTAGGDGPYDFVSRFFAPAAGVDEDPVTGSAHCVLGPYWAQRLGRTTLTGFQASSRGGVVRVRLEGARAHLAGRAVTVLRGQVSGADGASLSPAGRAWRS